MSKTIDIVLFGGTGDLSIRKLLPALFRCEHEGQLNSDTRIIATTHSHTEEQFYQRVEAGLQQYLSADEYTVEKWQSFKQRLRLVKLDIRQLDQQWGDLAEILNKQEAPRLFYMATAPSLYADACKNLAAKGLISEGSRIVLEKPIGYNLESATEIHSHVAKYFAENDIFRIDHYLGKETVQNLLALRFTNILFEQLWNRKSIDHVQITIAESVGLEGRAGFYDNAGAVRDMVQNHLLQLLCLIAMEPPHKMDADCIRQEKTKVIRALRPIIDSDVDAETVRGQYVGGGLDGDWAAGYLEELGDASSTTETYVAIRAFIDNWRWKDVPFYLRTGKRMTHRFAEIIVQFQPVPHHVYPLSAGQLEPNRLVIQLQPKESIRLFLMAKALNEPEMRLFPISLDMNFSEELGTGKSSSDGYKKMLLDVIAGDPSLFTHRDEVEAAWAWVDPILKHWEASEQKPALYRAGTYGPDDADELLKKLGHTWLSEDIIE